jgi:hypothetical protein
VGVTLQIPGNHRAHLPAEAIVVHLRRSQDSPNASFGIGHILP